MIRIFVGCSANGEDAEAQAMLEYSLHKHTARPLQINWMMLSRDPQSFWYSNPKINQGWNTRSWATPFSPFRYAIPYVCGFEGRAIYMDVDQVAMADIGDLWDQPIPHNKAALTKNEKTFCVMLLDNAKMKPIVPEFERLRREHMLYRSVRNNVGLASAPFKGNWNCLDGENYASLADPDIKIIHFTKVETQPHLKYALARLRASGQQHWNRMQTPQPHARADVQPFVDQLWESAQASGYTVEKYIPENKFGPYDEVRGGAKAA